LETEYAEGGLEILERRLCRHYGSRRVPSFDVFLYRLKKMKRKDALGMLQEMNMESSTKQKLK